MTTLPKSYLWVRTDTTGTDLAMLDDTHGLTAHGTAQAAIPLPYTCRYEVTTDESWTAKQLTVSVEGAGWLRTVRMRRADGSWRVSTTEEGDLDAALNAAGRPAVGLPGIENPDRLNDAVDVDLGAGPLFNTLVVRRLGLQDAEPGTTHRVKVAWVLVPSLMVVPTEQEYTVLEGGNVRYTSDGFSADLQLDSSGYVLNYPGLAELSGSVH